MNWFRRPPNTVIEVTEKVGNSSIYLKVESNSPSSAVDAFKQGLSLARQTAKVYAEDLV